MKYHMFNSLVIRDVAKFLNKTIILFFPKNNLKSEFSYEIFWSKTMTYYRLVNVNLNVVFHTSEAFLELKTNP